MIDEDDAVNNRYRSMMDFPMASRPAIRPSVSFSPNFI